MTPREKIARGRALVNNHYGTYPAADRREAFVDTLADVLLAAAHEGFHIRAMTEIALTHAEAEFAQPLDEECS